MNFTGNEDFACPEALSGIGAANPAQAGSMACNHSIRTLCELE